MEILTQASPGSGPVCLIIGNFDGLHIGHQTVISRARKLALSKGFKTVVLSFQPHPLKLLAPQKAPQLLQTKDQKIRLLDHYQVDAYWPLPFDESLSKLAPRAFIEFLNGLIDIRYLFVGFNFRFGHQRRGDIDLLTSLEVDQGFRLHVTEAVQDQGAPISSSRIRELVRKGDLIAAGHLLGRPYFLEGEVIEGQKLGRSLAAPTANIQPANELLPRFGVYATWVRLAGGDWHRAITNVGYAPTSTKVFVRVETHIFNFEADLYGETLQVYFGRFLRPEFRFPDLKALKTQIHNDFEQRLACSDSEPPEFFLQA